jgi:hypothetical protein
LTYPALQTLANNAKLQAIDLTPMPNDGLTRLLRAIYEFDPASDAATDEQPYDIYNQ